MAQLIIAPSCGAATSTNRPTLEGVQIDTSSRWCDEYTGTADALIAAGIITADQLPGQPNGPKVMATYYRGVLVRKGKSNPLDEHYLSVWRPAKARKVVVRRGIPPAEKERRTAEQDRQDDLALLQNKEEARRASTRLAEMPKTHAEYRAQQTHLAKIYLETLAVIQSPDEHHGYSYAEETRAEMAELAAEMLNLMKRGATVFSAKRHASIIQAHRAKIARGDKRFVGMLDSLQSVGVEVDCAEAVRHG